jgi:DNA-binding transcriptional LysR family regulator
MKIINHLDIFIKVTETGSFSEAARHFDITPSAVSRQISQLEQELSARLFQRTTRKQNLTEAGKLYYAYAQRINAEVEAAKLAVSQLTDTPNGTLHIAAEKDFAEVFIQPLLSDFLKYYPEIKIHLSLDTHLRDLVSGAFDIAIRIGHLNDSSLIARKLMSSQSVVCASPAYFEKYQCPKKVNDLSIHNCLSFRTNTNQILWSLYNNQQIIDVPVSGNFRANSLSILKDAAIKGLGIINIPRWFIQKEVNAGLLKCLDFQSQETPVNAVFTSNRQLAPKTRVFIDFLAENLST